MAQDGDMSKKSIDKAAQEMLLKVVEKGIDTIWDRYEAQSPVCKFGRQGLCCGGGGGKMWMEEEADKRVNQVRLKEIMALNPGAIGVACPYCLSMLDDAVKVKGLEEQVGVLDIAEIVLGAL